ncbi:MAG: hypothetical protein ACRD4Y_00745 [Candidatus Acidiferrales bacterium]
MNAKKPGNTRGVILVALLIVLLLGIQLWMDHAQQARPFKEGDAFTAQRANGALTVTKIQKSD